MGRDLEADFQDYNVRVSIHAPTWGATAACGVLIIVRYVSIHAPTWGATKSAVVPSAFLLVSIHAPTWGATSVRDSVMQYALFQFTRPRGARPSLLRPIWAKEVSIHAPTWGATCKRQRRFCLLHVSIHAPTWGATAITLDIACGYLFQFTRPRGARPNRRR